MTRVDLVLVTMAGSEYALFERDGGPAFPHGELRDGEAPAEAARRLVAEWTGTRAPKLEVLDFLAAPGRLTLVMRALLSDAPSTPHRRAPRMGLPAKVGALDGKYVEEALKTSLAYKLTRA
ncbi:MAG TPA: NUDIX domain-containing protein [Candidatus Thermoplasmatota archaeon]|nr:NUDIX domain-containing protein [Candidatus Thermoplasmatota archaeon]